VHVCGISSRCAVNHTNGPVRFAAVLPARRRFVPRPSADH